MTMQWQKLLSLKKQGDTAPRLRRDQNDTRLEFDKDYDRVIFSTAFRSLQDKTQIIPFSKTDFVHTRLTHSLEVSVVGRSIGRLIGEKIIQKYPELQKEGYQINDFGSIVATASLAHDIGNPPFGHSGEKAIGEYFELGNGQKFKNYLTPKQWQDLIDFEGNANGFHILTSNHFGNEGGLRMTYATLGAFMKYPKESLPKRPTTAICDKKFGVFQCDKFFFENVAQELGLIHNKSGDDIGYNRHPLAYLVEAADDICYTIIDFEDGINLGWIPEEFALEYLIKLVKNNITNKYNILTTKEERMSYLRALAIGSLINDVVRVFLENEELILQGKFPYSLTEKSHFKAQMSNIINISVKNIYHSNEVFEKELTGYHVITTLLDKFITAYNKNYDGIANSQDKLLLNLLPEKYHIEKENLYDRIMTICNFISILTDGKALSYYKMINI